MKAAITTIAAVAITTVLAVGIWQLGWFVEKKNTEKRVEIREQLVGTQTARRDQALDLISDWKVVTDPQAKATLRAEACRVIGTTGDAVRTPEITTFTEENC